MRTFFLSLAGVLTAGFLLAQVPKPSATSPDPKTPRPIDAVDTVWIEDLTWMEVRDAMKAGRTTVIIPTRSEERRVGKECRL